MIVRGKLKLENYSSKNNQARKPLKNWVKTAEAAEWNNIHDVRGTFRSADNYTKHGKNYIIFNIGGNNYRLVVLVVYIEKTLIIKKIMTHSEYSKNRWKDLL